MLRRYFGEEKERKVAVDARQVQDMEEGEGGIFVLISSVG
jgi:hypothetical protein